MKKYQLSIYSDYPEVHFELRTAACLARVSEKFIYQCECEELVTCHMMLHGRKGLCFTDVRKLKLIRHLHEDIGLALDVMDFVLQYRNRIEAMQRRLTEMEKLQGQKEQELLDEIRALRRQLAQVSDGH